MTKKPGPMKLRRQARIERIRAMQAEGKRNADIAAALQIDEKTMQDFIRRWSLQRAPRA